MRYTIIWEAAATRGMRDLRKRDGDRITPFVQAINALATNPEPFYSSKLGGGNRRLKVGRYRAMYEIDGNRIAVKLLMVGSVPV